MLPYSIFGVAVYAYIIFKEQVFWSNIMGVRKYNTQNIMKETTAKSVVNFAKFSVRTELITGSSMVRNR